LHPLHFSSDPLFKEGMPLHAQKYGFLNSENIQCSARIYIYKKDVCVCEERGEGRREKEYKINVFLCFIC